MKIFWIVIGLFVFEALLIGVIDLEVARSQYLDIIEGRSTKSEIENCIFDYSCNRYNDLLNK